MWNSCVLQSFYVIIHSFGLCQIVMDRFVIQLDISVDQLVVFYLFASLWLVSAICVCIVLYIIQSKKGVLPLLCL